jgi:hypothetical protein
MVVAGAGHLSFARRGFQAQVPDWVPADKDATVLVSGVVGLGLDTGRKRAIRLLFQPLEGSRAQGR